MICELSDGERDGGSLSRAMGMLIAAFPHNYSAFPRQLALPALLPS